MKSHLRTLVWLVCALLATSHDATAAPAHVDAASRRFSNLGVDAGLSQMSVMEIFQDSHGYMWFGTRNGLNKYDGASMKVYKPSRGPRRSNLLDNQITALAEDDGGNLWVGTSKGVSKLNMATDKITSYGSPGYPWLASGVRDLFVDSHSRLWIGTVQGLYLFEPETEQGQPIHLGGALDGTAVTVIREDESGRLLIGTDSKGFYVCDPSLKTFTHYDSNNGLGDENVTDILADNDHDLIWVSTANGGITLVDVEKGEIKNYNKSNSPLTTNNIRTLARDGDSLLAGTYDGIYSIDIPSRELRLHARADKGKGNLSHFSVYSLCVDRSGGLWVGTYSGGADYLSPYNNRFKLHETPVTSERDQMSGIYGPLVETSDGVIYVATEGGGLLEYDSRTGKSHLYPYDPTDTSSSSHNIIKSVLLDGEKVICGTAVGTLYEFDRNTKRFSLRNKFVTGSASIYSMVKSGDGSIWVATSKPSMSLLKISPDNEVQSKFVLADTVWKPGSARFLFEVSPDVMLIGTRNNGLYRYDHRAGTCENFTSDGQGEMFLPSDYVTSIVRDRKGRIWVSMLGGGISLYEDGKGLVKNVSAADGLADDDITMIVEDRNGLLWLSSGNAITSYNPDDGTVHNYSVSADLGAQEFTPHSGALLADGSVAFSTAKGLVTFNPANMQVNSYQPPVVFTSLEINNEKVVPSEDGVLKEELNVTPRIRLRHNENNITISYAALNYVHPEQNRYSLRLVGLDDEWVDVGHRRSAYFTNLKPGKYTFEVRAANNDGVWSDTARSLEIVVSPPWWDTWWAWTLYAVLFFGTIFLIGYYIIRKRALEERVRYQCKEQERAEEFHRTKMQMFTNFSHELRTPLTLIIPPLEELLHCTDFNHSVKNRLSLIYNNSQRMLILVNQLMDLRKSQSGKMKLKVSKEDMCSFLQEMYCAFTNLAEGKDIKFEFTTAEERLPAWFDKTVCDKVLFNLLSNAFKFTHPGGSVTMSFARIDAADAAAMTGRLKDKINPENKYVHLSVSDTGRGIPTQELVRIFDPFYQVDDQGKGGEGNTVGTGIGLSLTKLIVELHHGVIWADNNPEGGAVFHVLLPVNRSAYSEEEFDAEAVDRVVVDVIPSEAPENLKFDRRYKVLLVEDNTELRTYISECLSPYFEVIEADNGETAFDIAVERYPDIIVSDVMMPRKNGLELCAQIKEDMRTEHIPLILMTARCMLMNFKEGFSSGADDYIVKPFSMDVLIYRMRNILASREKLKKLYGKKFSLESMGIKIVASEDKFTQRLFELIETNIANPDLNIDMVCKELGMSRTSLYRKLKAMTDLSPVELIRNKRLEVATRLFRETEYSVSEVSTYVGFNGHAYFAQCFRALYGCSPSEYVAQYRPVRETPPEEDHDME